MTIVLDTNAYSDFKRGSVSVVQVLESSEDFFFNETATTEIYTDFRLGSRQKQNVDELHQFLDRPGVRVVPIDHGVARRYGDIVAALRYAGTPIPTNDIWIAAVAIEQNGELLTRDEHFNNVPMLRLHI